MARLLLPEPETPAIATTSPGTSSRSTDFRLWVSAPSRTVRSIGLGNVGPTRSRRKGSRGRSPSMPCLVGCLALAFPRFALILVWLFGGNYLARAYDSL